MAWQAWIEAPKQTIEFSAAPSFSSKKWIKLILKTIGNRKKRLCVTLRSEDKHHLRKSADWKAQIGICSTHRTDLCFSICRFSQVVFILWAQPHAQSLFLFQKFLVLMQIADTGGWPNASIQSDKSTYTLNVKLSETTFSIVELFLLSDTEWAIIALASCLARPRPIMPLWTTYCSTANT